MEVEGLHIQDIDTDKYLEMYFNQTNAPTREAALKTKEKEYNERINDIRNAPYLTTDVQKSLLECTEDWYIDEIAEMQYTSYWQPPVESEKETMRYIIKKEISRRSQYCESLLESQPLPKYSIISNYLNQILKEDLPNFDKIQKEVLEGRAIQDFFAVARYIGLIKFAQKLDNELNDEKNHNPNTQQPIKWIGKTAHLGYYMNLFAELGYIDAPKKKDGEINYNEFARQLAKTFDFDGNNIGTLAKALSPESNNMGIDNKDKINIPHLKDLT